MARKPRVKEETSMDSLLDALTNVVGILLLVLILTSLNMSSIVEKIVSNLPEVTQEDFERMKIRLEESERTRARMETTWADLKDKAPTEKDQLTQVVMAIEEKKDADQDVKEKMSDMDELKKLIETEKEKKEENTEDVNEAQSELASLKAALSEIPEPKEIEPDVITMPNPRLAPEESEPRYVICKGGKLYYVGDCYLHLFAARDLIDQNFQQLGYQGTEMGIYHHTLYGTRDDDRGRPEPLRDRDDRPLVKPRYDTSAVAKFFESNPKIGGEHFSYSVAPQSDNLRLRIHLRETGGYSIEQFKQRNSAFDLALKRVQGSRHYLMFYVAPDSFLTYTEARQMAEYYSIPAGWQPWSGTEFNPDPTIKRDLNEYDFDKFIPIETLEAYSAKLLPALEQNVEEAEAEVEATQDPELKEYVERWANQIKNTANQIDRMPEVADRFNGERELRILPQAPAIPHIYTFRGTSPPKEVPKPSPAPPKDPGAEDDKPAQQRDVLD